MLWAARPSLVPPGSCRHAHIRNGCHRHPPGPLCSVFLPRRASRPPASLCAPSSAGEPSSRGLLRVQHRPPAGTLCASPAPREQAGTLTSTEMRQEEGLEQETRTGPSRSATAWDASRRNRHVQAEPPHRWTPRPRDRAALFPAGGGGFFSKLKILYLGFGRNSGEGLHPPMTKLS